MLRQNYDDSQVALDTSLDSNTHSVMSKKNNGSLWARLQNPRKSSPIQCQCDGKTGSRHIDIFATWMEDDIFFLKTFLYNLLERVGEIGASGLSGWTRGLRLFRFSYQVDWFLGDPALLQPGNMGFTPSPLYFHSF